MALDGEQQKLQELTAPLWRAKSIDVSPNLGQKGIAGTDSHDSTLVGFLSSQRSCIYRDLKVLSISTLGPKSSAYLFGLDRGVFFIHSATVGRQMVVVRFPNSWRIAHVRTLQCDCTTDQELCMCTDHEIIA